MYLLFKYFLNNLLFTVFMQNMLSNLVELLQQQKMYDSLLEKTRAGFVLHPVRNVCAKFTASRLIIH